MTAPGLIWEKARLPGSPNTSVQVGDLCCYVEAPNAIGGFNTSNGEVRVFGKIVKVGPDYIQVNYDDLNNPHRPPRKQHPGTPPNYRADYVFFIKDYSINTTSLLGHYAEVELQNNSREEIELFSIGMELVESSK